MDWQVVNATIDREHSGACPRRASVDCGRHAERPVQEYGPSSAARPKVLDWSLRDRSQTSFAVSEDELSGARLTLLRSWFC